MAKIGSLLEIMPTNSQKCELLVEHILVPVYEVPESDMVRVLVGLDSPWYQETFSYFRYNIIPPHLTKTQQQTFIHRSARYSIFGDTLFWRHFNGTLLRCLDKEEIEWALCEVHEGI